MHELATDSPDLGITLTSSASDACLLIATCGDASEADLCAVEGRVGDVMLPMVA